MTQPTSQENMVERLAQAMVKAVEGTLRDWDTPLTEDERACGYFPPNPADDLNAFAAALIASEEALREMLGWGCPRCFVVPDETQYLGCKVCAPAKEALALVRALPGLKVED